MLKAIQSKSYPCLECIYRHVPQSKRKQSGWRGKFYYFVINGNQYFCKKQCEVT